MQKRGFQRIKIDGELYLIEDAPALDKKLKHDIEVVVDRVAVKTGVEQRLADSLETALGLSDGLVFAEDAKSGDITTFSAKFACPVSGFTIDEVEPRLFSFNNPFGACPKCDGLGHELYLIQIWLFQITVWPGRRRLGALGQIDQQIRRQTLQALALL